MPVTAGTQRERGRVETTQPLQENGALRLRTRLLALGIAALTAQIGVVSGSADATGTLIAQRANLQQQVHSLGADRAQAMTNLLAAEDALNNVRNELDHNRALLADLDRRQAALQAKIVSTQATIETQRALLAGLTRTNYKARASDVGLTVFFDSRNFGQVINSLMSQGRMQQRLSDTSTSLRVAEADLKSAQADLAKRHQQAAEVQASLGQENGRLLALVTDHDAQVSRLDSQQRGLLNQIASINSQISALTAPHFSSGLGSAGGGGSCGNHFDYGYCTWYVATRRCIPWFGNADEWYANARAYGYPEGSQAKPGAVVVWNAGSGMGGVGHVAYVESVQGDGFWVSEYNYTYGWNRYDKRFVSYSNPGPLLGFIYGR